MTEKFHDRALARLSMHLLLGGEYETIVHKDKVNGLACAKERAPAVLASENARDTQINQCSLFVTVCSLSEN
jgi:hypothetical protein